MESQDELIQVLTRLGLTTGQVRVYLALVQLGTAPIKKIAGATKIARQDIYRIVSALEKVGLVEKAITTPTTFKAIPLRDGISFLLESRGAEFSDLHEKAMQLIKIPKMENEIQDNNEEGPDFVLIPEKKNIEKRRRDEIEAAQLRINVVALKKNLPRIKFLYSDVIMKALKKGVKIRLMAIENAEDKNSFPDLLNDLKKYPSFEIRHASAHPPIILAVYDGKRMLMTTTQMEDMTQSPALWSKNRAILATAEHYFEMLWERASVEYPMPTQKAPRFREFSS